MKKYSFLSLLFVSGMVFSSCNKEFLDRYPQTQISEENFFKTTSDLETYSNTFYSQLAFTYDDIGSDNVSSYSGGGEVNNLLAGNLTPSTVTGWDDWSNLRTVNYLLDHASGASGDSASINHYVGIARFFRAMFYIVKVKRYSNVPWVNHAMSNTDTALLYKPEDPRALVVDSIVSDLQYAANNILTSKDGNRTRVTKWSALALLSRFCLFEGTFRKYHSEVQLNDGNRFLQMSIAASQQLMASRKFQIVGSSAVDYGNLFASSTLAGNNEIIQWQASDPSLGVGNNSHTVLGWEWALSKSLEESYLMMDGSRFTDIATHDTMGFVQVFKNRDPRLAQTFAYPGFSNSGGGVAYIAKPNLGGYDQIKYYPKDASLRGGWELNYTGLPLFRYAEVLLNYIEAKAELGDDIAQSDLDATVNLLRDRVAMPHMNLSVQNNMDPVLTKYYPNVTGKNQGLILEIRRERRVELACEGLRLDDLNRWYAGQRIGDAQQGIYVKSLGGLDLTGDGLPDIAILPSVSDSSALNSLSPAQRNNISARYYLTNSDGTSNNFYLTKSTSGNIAFTADKGTRQFIEPKYYYRPVPLNQTVLNPKLAQPFGW